MTGYGHLKRMTGKDSIGKNSTLSMVWKTWRLEQQCGQALQSDTLLASHKCDMWAKSWAKLWAILNNWCKLF